MGGLLLFLVIASAYSGYPYFDRLRGQEQSPRRAYPQPIGHDWAVFLFSGAASQVRSGKVDKEALPWTRTPSPRRPCAMCLTGAISCNSMTSYTVICPQVAVTVSAATSAKSAKRSHV